MGRYSDVVGSEILAVYGALVPNEGVGEVALFMGIWPQPAGE